MSEIAVYGSLRKGEYNYDRFGGEKSFCHKGSYVLDGFKLYSLGSYPGIKKAPAGNTIVVDVLYADEQTSNVINHMEIGAGYHAEKIKVGNHEPTIYIYDGQVSENQLIVHGDWTKR